jgi:chorismate synthase
MSGNTFGKIFKITSFGESHGAGLGVVIDGCPSNIRLNLEQIQQELNRRRPGQSDLSSPRKEMDEIQLISGLFEGRTTGAPLCFFIKNKDAKSEDYKEWDQIYRPSHADYTYLQKYGLRDHRGSGRASARETINRVIGGAVAKQLLAEKGIQIFSYTEQIGHIKMQGSYVDYNWPLAFSNELNCPDSDSLQQMLQLIKKVKREGDSVGGTIKCVIQGCPAGLGEPVFEKMQALLGSAILSINACKGIDFGAGFDSLHMTGSSHNDLFNHSDEGIKTKTNHSGGIQGGISNGMDIVFRALFKPVATIAKAQNTIDQMGREVSFAGTGRHDPCVVPRAMVIVEAMAALVILDLYMENQAKKW